ncbi:hypothetical protein Nepgr_014819 [Nepenthes gracilis]|uniref:Uncharacterized protein n=1 Tax=Nepenthes gracilis TaxID=150966 RepID=A0AAD3SK72_NEPGR|nr:hypothetical protein Nepgr_014819 [Nepenthes gracilis]
MNTFVHVQSMAGEVIFTPVRTLLFLQFMHNWMRYDLGDGAVEMSCGRLLPPLLDISAAGGVDYNDLGSVKMMTFPYSVFVVVLNVFFLLMYL